MIERHVASLDLSLKLKEAGFPQECNLAWYESKRHGVATGEFYVGSYTDAHSKLCAAPLLSEIMEQVPEMRVVASRTAEAGMWWTASIGNRGEARTAWNPCNAVGALWLALRGEK